MILTYFGPGRCEGTHRFTGKLVSRLFRVDSLLMKLYLQTTQKYVTCARM